MDKNKNRTDLIAAGRKKLQQFRQKKDGKGSSSQGKSSKKSSKSEQHEADVDAASADAAAPTGSLTPEEENASHVEMNLRVVDSNSTENLQDPEVAVVASEPSSVAIVPESSSFETPLAHEVELPPQELGLVNIDASVHNGESTQNVDVEEAREMSLETVGIPVFEGETKYADMAVISHVSVLSELIDTRDGEIVTAETDGVNESLKSVFSQEILPDTSSIQARGDQVTDVGAMQEADGSGLKQFDDRSYEPEHKGDGNLILSEFVGSVAKLEESASEVTDVYEITHEVKPTEKVDYATESTLPAIMSDAVGFSSPILDSQEADGTLAVSHQDTSQLKDVVAGLANEEISEILRADYGKDWKEGAQADTDSIMVSEDYNERQYMTEGNVQGRSVAEEMLSPSVKTESFVGDGFSVSFLQLKEVVRRLSEDEFQSLLNLRGPVSNAQLGTDSLILAERGYSDSFERLKEELYLTSFGKDIFHLQLSEMSDMQFEFDRHHQLLEEISVLCTSLNEVQERRECLAAELSHCRSELLVVDSRREELENQVHLVKAEAQEFSGRALELQFSLERSQGDLSSLSMELADCKDLVASLRLENENLNGTLASVMEDRRKLVEEKESYQHENEKLSSELANCKSLVAALEVEISNFSGTLALGTEERKKLEEEKESLAHENGKISMELTEWKDLAAALRAENADLNGSLSLITEERKELDEEKESVACENDKLFMELTDCKGLVAALQLEISHLNESLAKIIAEREKLKEDKEFFVQENERLSNDLLVSKEKLSTKNEEYVQDRGISTPMLDKPSPDGPTAEPLLNLLEHDVVDDSFVLVVLKEHLEEAEKLLQNLEKAIEGMHSESMSSNRSSGEVASPAVSRLIQAFESKVQHDEHEAEEKAVTEDQSPRDLFILTKEQTGSLRVLLQQLHLDAEKLKEECRKASKVPFKELKVEYEAMKQHSDNLEAENIELGILYEAVKEHVWGLEEKNNELQVLYEASKQQGLSLKAEYAGLGVKVSEYQSRVSELLSQLYDLQRSSDEKALAIENQLESLQKEATERALILEQEWNTTIAQIIETIGRLDVSIERVSTSAISPSTDDGLDVNSHIAASVSATIKVIEDLQEKLEVARADNETVCSSSEEVKEKFNDLLRKNESTSVILHKIYDELRKLVIDSCGAVDDEHEMNIEGGTSPDSIDYIKYKTIVDQLETFLGERLQLQSLNNELNSELIRRANDIEELNRKCLDLDAIQKLIEDVEGVVKLDCTGTNLDKTPASHLESLVSSLVQKYKQAGEQVTSSTEEFGSKEMELIELQEKVHQLSALNVRQEIEILALKESLSQAEEVLAVARSESKEKISELEQSDQRVSSIREKLSIAVAKGKGLVVQRDSLKQSLAQTSNELERCSHELQLKDARLHELETKLKSYMEAGERVEALESELSYIRNSATALRESFLLKDSVLQRIEEILEDLDLPEQFHSRGTIEKVEWLARSATGNSVAVTDWDQKSSIGGSYTDAGFVVMDAWKEDAPLSTSSGDDMRRKYEELQGKFYGLAEQNEMLEQSLMERNLLVQRWEEVLDRINMPSHMRSMEPEDRIEWLGTALLEANQENSTLQQKIDNLENYCGSVAADLEESQEKISGLEAELQAIMDERENLSERLKILISDHEDISAKAVWFQVENEKLQNEVTVLHEKLAEKVTNEDRIHNIEGEIHRLEDLVSDALQYPGAKELVSGESTTECLEVLLSKLIERYSTLATVKPSLEGAVDERHSEETRANLDESGSRDMLINEEPCISGMKKDLEEALQNLMHVKEERDVYMERQKSLLCEVEALDKKRGELQELLIQEEQKSASLREKLTVAVRKGKSLVQQRDSLKQTVEEMNNELEHLKSEIRDLSTYSKTVEALESERLFLRNCLTETERLLQEREHILNVTINALGDIDVGGEIKISDPVQKIEQIGKQFRDLHAALASSEQESRKSRRAAELLLAELNEVQERNDTLQEELANTANELADISKERGVAEAAKLEALSRLEQLSAVNSEGKQKQYSELMALKIGVDELKKLLSDINNLSADVLSKDFELLQNVEIFMESCLKQGDTTSVIDMPTLNAYGGNTSSNSEHKEKLLSVDSWLDPKVPAYVDDSVIIEVYSSVGRSLQELKTDIGVLKEKLYRHPVALHDKASDLSKIMEILSREMSSQINSFEVLKRDIMRLESIEKEKDMEIVTLRRNFALLYDACANSIMEIENRKTELIGNKLVVQDLGMNLNPASFVDGGLSFGGQTRFSEECVKAIAEKLLSALKDFAIMKTEIVEGNLEEMKITIANLRRELQEKDIQKDRICAELVSQIKEAEAAVRSYSQDTQSSQTRVFDMELQMKMMEEEQSLLEQRVKELLDEQAALVESQDRVKSLSDVLVAKDQEIEALMQALDEEETQMEELKNKLKELEKVVQQKNIELENLEASRGKISKRLSVTVNKFDELHHLSESLLAEVEKLQSQLQDRDSEISFLRQEVTRCTNDVLVASQMSNKRDLEEVQEFLSWFDSMISRVGVHDLPIDDRKNNQVHEYKETLQKKISAIISEFEGLRVVSQSQDALLQVEKSKVQELTRREEILRKSLSEKESQINMLEGVEDSGRETSLTSEILEVEPLINKWAAPGPSTTSQVRSLRKVNNDQVAIAIDTDPGSSSGRLEDEDEDKVHGFKSLTTSKIVPRFTRPATDMIDGLWVSCDRALMRQPALRLGIIVYWAVLHALLASFVF
ncbi:abnormal long morphology protein 1 isoform X1 [Pistacia vera]|uniref:abnormal long morphology protein 1 isoform X1 n=2 Tax=Pistacia vera TaxID=55513 RepID=UPI001263CC76|nr:abnormal long morphology protein 1 isoform X1 [Pistacia vera]